MGQLDVLEEAEIDLVKKRIVDLIDQYKLNQYLDQHSLEQLIEKLNVEEAKWVKLEGQGDDIGIGNLIKSLQMTVKKMTRLEKKKVESTKLS